MLFFISKKNPMTTSQGKNATFIPENVLLSGIVLSVTTVIGLIAIHQPLLAIAAVLTVPITLAILARPDVATVFAIFILYSNAAVVAVKFHGVPFVVGAAYIFLLVIPIAHYVVFQRQKLISTPLTPLIIALLIIQLLGTLFSDNIETAFSNFMTFFLEGVLIYFLVTNAVRSIQALRLCVWALLLAGILLGGIPLFQQVTGTFHNNYGGFGQISELPFHTDGEKGEVEQFRLAGALGEKNRYSQVMLLLVPLGFFRIWGERSTMLRYLALISTALCLAGAALSFSRGTAVAFALLLIIMAFMRIIKFQHLAMAGLGILILLVMLPQYSARLVSIPSILGLFSEHRGGESSEPDGAIKGRATEMLATVLIFADYPILGVGPGMSKYYIREYGNQLGLRILDGDRQAHSFYLQIAAENGLFGIVLYLAILGITLRNLLRVRERWLEEHPDLAYLATGLFFTIVAYSTTALFLHLSYLRYFWLMLALANVACHVATTKTVVSKES